MLGSSAQHSGTTHSVLEQLTTDTHSIRGAHQTLAELEKLTRGSYSIRAAQRITVNSPGITVTRPKAKSLQSHSIRATQRNAKSLQTVSIRAKQRNAKSTQSVNDSNTTQKLGQHTQSQARAAQAQWSRQRAAGRVMPSPHSRQEN